MSDDRLKEINGNAPYIKALSTNNREIAAFPNKNGELVVNIYDHDTGEDVAVTLDRESARLFALCVDASIHPESVAADRVITGQAIALAHDLACDR